MLNRILINLLQVAVVMALLTWLGTPHEAVNRQLLAKADWGGMLLLGAALAMIYAGLDQGNRLDWFGSGVVTSLIAGGSVLFIGFIINEAMVREPWASPTVLFSRNVILVLLTLVAYMVTSQSNTMLITNFLTTVGQFRRTIRRRLVAAPDRCADRRHRRVR